MADTIKRAYELAPHCKTLDDVRAKLKREGLEAVDAHLGSTTLRKELQKLLKS